ncbi:TRAP transporter substrate-binding protein [Rhodobacter capsulatus]|uniref:C4-dicarboxylate-binding periplasmic protein DctP n=2 Tax=Rhodobacter capsulatus TaxID=1061 RepID=DCTP_RHOCA|nr:TRAP transporter substrate-binding protein [Rhodobacter capsulatus]P37735.1 RecName: Full=C4-dicarboxylate-binding periplasmic protein DctP; Flags: Precursor [Rhodobacter capsulatus]ADE86748.1 TRAP dicarboxylate transporter, DctP-3 subunit [Rhodobacter capsulatus SB 1003]ETD00307.1 C4-dicarboxylate ABC transporter [Rhodobacter capsulatus DE442]ETD74647.1 C4-dicarboxylate ABC transporter [Rhodobacter capsulatus R121]ETE52510.1 C4-dicarboxylate ABC transporter [Rhodobacter capsulatus Y262]MD
MLTRRILGALVGATALSLALSVPALAEPIVIKFSHVVAPDTPKGKGAAKFEELAEKYTNGAVDVEVYPNSQLYKDKEELEALQLGAVQMLAPSLAKFGPLGVQDFEVFDLPYIFKDYEALHKVTQGEAGKMLLSKLEAKGITGLAFWDNGFKIMSANTPLTMPDDFLGLKMRIQSSKVLEAEMNALGAVPQVMAFSEVYQALQTGVVDGTENPPSNMFTQKMNEVQKHATVSNHGYLGYAVIVNKQFWDGLPADVRTGLEKAMAESTDYANGIAKEENEKALQAMKDAGTTEFHELTAEERAAWEEVLTPVHDEMAERIGAETIAAVKAATAE